MATSKDNIRVNITMKKEEYKLLEELAKNDDRTVTGLSYKIVKDYLRNTNKQGTQ